MFDLLNKYLFLSFLFFLFPECRNVGSPEDKIIARVGTTTLYHSELSSVIPNDAIPEDSAMMADDYINKWIKQELLLQKAMENLSPEQKDVTRELEDYKNSLLIYRYKNELIAQRMDTTITEEHILDFYTENSASFKLKNNIVKAIFIKTPNELANPEQLRQLCSNDSEEGILELRDFCVRYAKNYDILTDRWVDFEVIANKIPQSIDQPERFLRNNDIMEFNDSTYYYFINIQDYKLKNEQAPLEYVRDNIKNLILNRRKIEFLKQIENNVYSEGIRKNNFKIFN